MSSALRRLHNPSGRRCGCDADCWCRTTLLGRAVKWWFPAERFGIHHKNDQLHRWQDAHTDDDPSQWKRSQDERYGG